MATPKKPSKKTPSASKTLVSAGDVTLLADVRKLIADAREVTATAVNSALVLLYWQVGHRIRTEVLGSKRADYGEQILVTLSQELEADFGNGFSPSNLSRMMGLVEAFPEREVVLTLSSRLGWSHFVAILPLKEPLKREFYAEMCRVERWSVRTLREKIGGALFERTALSKKPKKLAEQELAKLRETDQLILNCTDSLY